MAVEILPFTGADFKVQAICFTGEKKDIPEEFLASGDVIFHSKNDRSSQNYVVVNGCYGANLFTKGDFICKAEFGYFGMNGFLFSQLFKRDWKTYLNKEQ